VRNFALAISITVLLFIGYTNSFAQQTGSSFFLEISNESINPGEIVSVRILGRIEPNSVKEVMVRFLPPPGSDEPMQSSKLQLQADSVGFVNGTVRYPNDIQLSTMQPGNYTVLVQDMQTGTLIQRDSFEVSEPPSFLDILSDELSAVPLQILLPVVIGLAGGGFTYLYNLASADRERKKMLFQKKAEYFLELSPRYKQIVRSMRIVAHLLEEYRQTGRIDDDIYHRCFYNLAVLIRERNKLRDEPAAYFFTDPTEENMLAIVETNIVRRLEYVFSPTGLDKLQYILSQGKTIRDLRIAGHNKVLFDTFKNWLNHGDKEIDEFVYDLKLYSYIISYVYAKMFQDWYPRKATADKRIDELIKQIIPMLRWDNRYRSLSLDFLPSK
jgi:hypothetical protein